jgi:hypothetical protein
VPPGRPWCNRYPRFVAEKEASRDDDERADLDLMRKAEAALAEIDRTQGLEERHAAVLAALRIRIEGGPRKSLEELVSAAGEIRGKAAELDERMRSEEARKRGDLGDLFAKEPKKGKSLDDLLGDG